MKILRIVRLQFSVQNAQEFERYFASVRKHIAEFPGCLELRHFRDAEHAGVFYTYSLWRSAEDLQAYRNSELFRTAWQSVKPLFGAPAQAFSLVWEEQTERQTEQTEE
ncbi:MAG: antibiotic biosynthesis monooxygenase family protein [Bacteroidia bacterium]|nr:antibiotic biosynthesis monooxygenase [Bacteroidia bacterium]MDW8333793.1 antibiotic biosynthesis monooxygenase family protein [Bacteroidia bacterium]